MVFRKEFKLPTEEELTVPELDVTSAALHAAAFHLGLYCEEPSKEYMLCKAETPDPRKCLDYGKALTGCGIDFFQQVKKSCLPEFVQYQKCLISSSGNYEYQHCRKTQHVFDECVKKHIGVERPRPSYFCEPKIFDSKRPEPEKPSYAKLPDPTPGLPDGYEKDKPPTAWRFTWFN